MGHSAGYTLIYYTLMLTFSPAWAVFHALGFTQGGVAPALSLLTTAGAGGALLYWERRRKLGMAGWIALVTFVVVGNIWAVALGGYG